MMLTNSATRTNPFPGLRPFESNENHLFFGRDGQSDELLRRLRRKRFLAVVGTSGSGKSSLVHAGLLPALHGGFMIDAGSSWHVTVFRPGNDPIGNMAAALNKPDILDSGGTDAAIQRAIIEAALRRSALGLVGIVRQARIPAHENLLIVVDQFEEIFRFKQSTGVGRAEDDAAAFVKLLLEATKQDEVPVYVAITMRSDFLGDCAQFRDLPEAINDSQYLIPRMTRTQRREAISGPVAVGGAEITPRLMNRLLNDVGDDPDQLPILQHALMRTWQRWAAEGHPASPLDIQHYEAIGGMAEALSRHADKAYNELPDERSRKIAEKLFKLLTERGSDNREIRRPTKLEDICAVAEAEEGEVIAVIEHFRREGRSFLMPPSTVALNGDSLIDISHESLIRGWQRLKVWVDEEARSARIYRRLAETAALYAEGKAGLWRDPDLFIALSWREANRPNEAWGARYYPDFANAMAFLEQSRETRDAELAAQEWQRIRNHRRTKVFAAILGLAFVISLALALYAFRLRAVAIESREDALKQAQIADFARASAEDQRMLAVRNQKEAEAAKERALRSERKAAEDAERARRAEQQASLDAERARVAERKASAEARRAVASLRVAEEEKQRAERNEQLARESVKLAQESELRARKLAHQVRKQNIELNYGISFLAQRLAQLSPLHGQARWNNIRADALLRMEDRESALRVLTQILDVERENYHALLSRSYLYLLDGQAQKAVDDARAALKLHKNSFVGSQNLAAGLIALGLYPEAAEQLDKSINSFMHIGYGDYSMYEISPDIQRATGQRVLFADSSDRLPAAYYQRATLAAAAGTNDFEAKLEQADSSRTRTTSVDAYLLALNSAWTNHQRRPDDYGVLVAQGALWERAGFKDEAIRSYARFQCKYQSEERKHYAHLAKWASQRMAELHSASFTCPVPDPKPAERDARLMMLEATEALVVGRPVAYERFREAAKDDPTNVNILIQRSKYRYDYADFYGARDDAETAVRLEPRTATAYLYRALANANIGANTDDIRRDIQKARELNPTLVPRSDDVREGVYKISKVLADISVDEAVDLLQRTARYDMPSAKLYYEMAKLLNEKQRYAEALEKINLAIALKSDDLSFYEERARIEEGLRQQKAASGIIKQRADVLRNQALGYEAAGDTLLRLGKKGEALHAYGESLKLYNNLVHEKHVEEVQCEAVTTLSKVSRIIEGLDPGIKELDSKNNAVSYLENEFGAFKGLDAILKSEINRLRSEINRLSSPQ